MLNRLFPARCPVDEETREWLVYRFRWLVDHFGPEAIRRPVVCPTDEEFPERFDGTPATLDPVLRRIAERIGVDPDAVDLHVYEETDEQGDLMRSGGLAGRWSTDGAAGIYVEDGSPAEARYSISIEQSVALHPTSAVATLAHELCHALLLGKRYLTGDEEDGEPLTDLATIYFGYGIFSANALIREVTWESVGMTGWSVGRQGYLTFPIAGFALALLANARAELRPPWVRYLRPDARASFRQGMRYLRARPSAGYREGSKNSADVQAGQWPPLPSA